MNDIPIDTLVAETGTVDTTTAEASPLSKEHARRVLQNYKDNDQQRPAIRMLAKDWGWSPATTGRFVQAFDDETSGVVSSACETKVETAPPSLHQRREMLIEGAKDFEAKLPPEAPAELVDRMAAEGKISLSATDEPDGETIEFTWADGEDVVIRERRAIAAYFNQFGELVIRQKCWPEDDPIIYVPHDDILNFLEKLSDICGIQSVGRQK